LVGSNLFGPRYLERGEFMKKVKEFLKIVADILKTTWNKLPKTAKVFVYVFVSYTLKAISVELGMLEDSALADYLVGVINLAIVFIQEAVPAVKAKLVK
jgi:hypothetical protein